MLITDSKKRAVATTATTITNHITTNCCATQIKREGLRDHNQAKMKETMEMWKELMKQLRKKER